jgi:hypothetical protein
MEGGRKGLMMMRDGGDIGEEKLVEQNLSYIPHHLHFFFIGSSSTRRRKPFFLSYILICIKSIR